jgi:tripartite-type tricarboxylate transporter receptor subunit TctC
MGGHVDFFCDQAVSVTGQILSGAVKAYAISGEKRLATLPEVPTARELGVDYRMNIWAGMFAPKGVDKEIVLRLADALDKTLDDPAVQKRLADIGGAIPAKDERAPSKFDKFVRDEIARWAPILKAASGGTMN